MSELALTRNQYLEVEKIGLGAFAPLTGFMNEAEVRSVANSMRLPSGDVFTIPVILDLGPAEAQRLKGLSRVTLVYDGVEVAEFSPEDIYSPDKLDLAAKIFCTTDPSHPGVAHLMTMGSFFSSGPIAFKTRVPLDISEFELTPDEVKCLEELWRMGKLNSEDMIVVISVSYPKSGNRMNLLQTHLVGDLIEALGWI